MIGRLRKGDNEAEEFLYNRYYKRILHYVYNNIWYPDIKDIENTVQDIWIKLRKWFMKNYIEKSESAVVNNKVRSWCANVGKKDNREPSYGLEPIRSNSTNKEGDNYNDKNLIPSVQKEIFVKLFMDHSRDSNTVEEENMFKISFNTILSKCLKLLPERQCIAIDHYFYRGQTFEEIGIVIGKTGVTAHNNCKEALINLRRCFKKHNIFSVGDIK